MKFKAKNTSLSLIGCVLLGTMWACSDDFLIDANETDLTTDVVFSADRTAVAAVTGVYDGFQNDSEGDPGVPNEYNVKGVFGWANYMSLDWQTPTERDDNNFFNFEVNADGEVATKIWPNHYRQIGRANAAIEGLRGGLDAGNLTGETGQRLLGETLVLRSISYQYLAAAYGDVPLMLNLSDDPLKARDPQDMVFEQIVTDMEEAIPYLPWSYDSERGRVSKGTAYAVLGNALMWLGRYPEAVTAFEEIEAGGVTSLEPNFLDVHALANANGVESLFELQWAADGDLSWGRNDEVSILQLFTMPADIRNGDGAFAGIPTQELWASFEAGDLRRQATVIGPDEEHPDPLIDINMYDGIDINTAGTAADPWTGNPPAGMAENPQRTGYWGIKGWRDPAILGWGSAVMFGGQNHIWIRYGEVLLSLSEAALKAGDMGTAQAAFDRVRNRGWGGTAPALTVSMDNILQEYRHELAGEFSLWAVIRRSGEAAAYLSNNYGVSMPAGFDVIPIPNSVMTINPNLEPNPSN
ncbi:RagB/SusD family nutrient uptake outer membrane protein [Ekhidna sp.]